LLKIHNGRTAVLHVSNSLVPVEQVRALGESEAFIAVQERISLAAKTNRPVILLGERGTGKELAAARLHLLSRRWGQPYVTINCASLSESLIESELFGHEAGAFTGAVRLRKGRFEYANAGTLFLDEIATLPLPVQEKILRVVEYGQMERVGSSDTRTVDVRLIAATNVDLRECAEQGRFRQDLLDRLSFEVIVLPPLRERREDILLLANYFARHMCSEMGVNEPVPFSRSARKALLDYHWPGNIRELKNVIERSVYRCTGAEIEEIQFDPFEAAASLGTGSGRAKHSPQKPSVIVQETGVETSPTRATLPISELTSLPLTEAVRSLELWRIQRALEECRFNRRKAAQRLGLTYEQLRNCIRKHADALDCSAS
jgi:psp operon transcriptional activator